MTSEPTTAQVSEPVRAKRPTLYGALWHTARGIWNISGLYESPIPQDDYEHVAARALCFITIPGDDAPPATAKELDPLPFKIRHNTGIIVAAFVYFDQAERYMAEGYKYGGWNSNELEMVNANEPPK